MNTLKYLVIFSFISAIIGFFFSVKFQSMAYLGSNGTLSMKWFWLGAVLSYIFSILAIVFLVLYKKNNIKPNYIYISLKVVSIILIVVSMIWTTFIIIAWNSGF